jgi:hypothetical protein
VIVQAALRTVGVAPAEAKRVDVGGDLEFSEDVERGEVGGSISEAIAGSDEAGSAQISEAVSEIYQGETDAAIDYTPDEGGFEEGADAET